MRKVIFLFERPGFIIDFVESIFLCKQVVIIIIVEDLLVKHLMERIETLDFEFGKLAHAE